MRLFFILTLAILFSCNSQPAEPKGTPANMDKITQYPPANQEEVELALSRQKISFPSKDNLPITADVYLQKGMEPTMLLCHQAGFSRGEYKNTALKINDLGISCMAIDQRSGKEAQGVINETAKAAVDKSLPTSYLDARQDIEAAIDYLYERNGNQPIILVGSSYSASLSLLIGKDNPKVKAIAAFSPGEYFKGVDIAETIKGTSKPVFVTSSKKESPGVETLTKGIDAEYLTHYKPEVEGIHGSRALWESTEGNGGYWGSFKEFLKYNN